MAIDSRLGTIELSTELQQGGKEMLGRLDTAMGDDPNIIACDQRVRRKIESHLRRKSEMVEYGHDTGSFFVLHTTGFATSQADESLSQNRAKVAPSNSSERTKENTFRRTGRFWTVIFDNQESHIKDSTGIRYLHRLVAQPNKNIPAVILFSEKSGIDPAAMSGSEGQSLDAEAYRKYEERLSELAKDIEQARDTNDTVTVETSEREFETLANEMSISKGLGGKPRQKTDSEKTRKAVGNAIRRAIESISQENASLGIHFENAISKGVSLVYSPETPIEWLT